MKITGKIEEGLILIEGVCSLTILCILSANFFQIVLGGVFFTIPRWVYLVLIFGVSYSLFCLRDFSKRVRGIRWMFK